MAKTKGILLGQDFDLAVLVAKDKNGLIKSGLIVGDSVYQQQTLLMLLNKGEIKEYPTAGVGINSFLLDDSSSDDITREIGEQFSNDGMRVYELSYIEGKLTVDANYEGSSSFK